MSYPNQFYMPGQQVPNPGQLPPGFPQQQQSAPQPFNLAALQQAQMAARTGTPPQQMNQMQALLQAQAQAQAAAQAQAQAQAQGMGMGGLGQLGQIGQQMGQMAQAQAPQQPQQGGGQINMAAFQQLLNSGQMVRSSCDHPASRGESALDNDASIRRHENSSVYSRNRSRINSC